MNKSPSNLFLMICLFGQLGILSQAEAQRNRRDDPGPGPGFGGNGSNNSSSPSPTLQFNPASYFQSSQIAPSQAHFVPLRQEAIYSDLKKRLRYAPYLEVNQNQGGLKTSFSVPVPPNLSPFKELVFSYHSSKETNEGYGYGWALNLPSINPSYRGRQFAPYVVQGLSSAELSLSQEDLSPRRAKIESLLTPYLEVNALSPSEIMLTPYRAVIDQDFHSYVRFEAKHLEGGKRAGWLVSTLQGQHWIFDQKGRVQQALNQEGEGLSFHWLEGHLLSIYQGTQGLLQAEWQIHFDYLPSRMLLPQWQAGEFIFPKEGLSRMRIYHQKLERPHVIHFRYHQGYLLHAAYENGLIPLFQGSYATPRGEIKDEGNDFQGDDQRYPYFTHDESISVWEEKSDDHQTTLLVDLNNDGLTDKVILDFEKKYQSLKNFLSGHEFYGGDQYPYVRNPPGSGEFHIDRDPRFRGHEWTKFHHRINGEDPSYRSHITFLIGRKNGTDQVEYEEKHPFGHLESWKFPPFLYRIKAPWKDVAPRVRAEVMEAATIPNALRFVDMNGDNRKDLVFCQGVEALEEKSISLRNSQKHSNLMLSLLKLKFPHWMEGKDFTFIFDHEEGHVPQIIYQQVDVDGQLVQESLAEDPNRSDLPYSLFSGEERPEILREEKNLSCHQYSIFYDFNQDGVVDVLTGRKLYLRGKGNGFLALKLSNHHLRQLFDDSLVGFVRQDPYTSYQDPIDLSKGDLTLGDVDGNGRLNIIQGKDIQINSVTGQMVLALWGRTLTYDPLPRRKLLNQFYSPFGGQIEVTYRQQNGQWVVEQIEKDPKGDQAKTHIRYRYEQRLLDPFTGFFLGFHQVTEEKEVVRSSSGHHAADDNPFPKRKLKKTYDNILPSLKNTYYLSRGMLQGHPTLEQVYSEKGKVLKANYSFWDKNDLSGGRIFPFIKQKVSKLWNEGDTESSSNPYWKKVVNQQYTNWWNNFFPLKSMSHEKVEGEKATKTYQAHYTYIPKLSLRVLKQEDLLENEMKVKPSSYLFYNELGQVKSIRFGEEDDEEARIRWIDHDELGRVIKIKESNGYSQNLTYEGSTPLVKEIADLKGHSSINHHPLHGQIQAMTTPLGAEWMMNYSSDGILLSQSLKNQNGLIEWYRLKRPELNCTEDGERYYVCLLPSVISQTYAENPTEWQMDGMGRVEKSKNQLNGHPLFSGRSFFGEDEEIWKVSRPQYQDQVSGEVQRIWHNALGEVEFSWDARGRRHQIHREGLCQYSSVDQYEKESGECRDGWGNLIHQRFRGETLQLTTNLYGELMGISELGLSWNYDQYGILRQSQGMGANPSRSTSPSWSSEEYTYKHKEGTLLHHKTGWLWQYDALGNVIKTQKVGASSKTDVFEEIAYEKGLPTVHHYLDFQGQEVLKQQWEYNSLGAVTRWLKGDLDVFYQYDIYGKIKGRKILFKGQELAHNHYDYRDNYLFTSVGIVDDAEVDALQNLVTLKFKNGLILKREFEEGSPLLTYTEWIRSDQNDKNPLWSEDLIRNTADQVKIRTTWSSLSSISLNGLGSPESDIFHYDSQNHTLKDEKLWISSGKEGSKKSFKRDERGRVINLDGIDIEWNGDNISHVGGHDFYYDHQGSLLATCPQGHSLKEQPDKCLIKLSPDMVVINGKLVQLEIFNGLKIGVRIDKDFYPLVTDHLGSVRGMISPDGKDVLWRRDYSAWGHKKTLFNEKSSLGLEKIKKLEELVVWSFAGLMEIPGLNENTGNILYWSQSRVYSPDIQEWLSIDSLIKMNPAALIGQPGNWKATEYASNDPMNFVDITGHAVTVYSRELNMKGGRIGSHTYIEVIKNDGSRFQISGTGKLFSKLEINIGKNVDTTFSSKQLDAVKIKAPPGMSLQSWDDRVLSTAKSLQKEWSGKLNYKLFGGNGITGANCHRVTREIIDRASGGHSKELNSFNPPGANPGLRGR